MFRVVDWARPFSSNSPCCLRWPRCQGTCSLSCLASASASLDVGPAVRLERVRRHVQLAGQGHAQVLDSCGRFELSMRTLQHVSVLDHAFAHAFCPGRLVQAAVRGGPHFRESMQYLPDVVRSRPHTLTSEARLKAVPLSAARTADRLHMCSRRGSRSGPGAQTPPCSRATSHGPTWPL